MTKVIEAEMLGTPRVSAIQKRAMGYMIGHGSPRIREHLYYRRCGFASVNVRMMSRLTMSEQ
jgi:hypothetical protein